MADVTIDALFNAGTARGRRVPVWTTQSIGYVFYFDSDGTFVYQKTTDGGATWGGIVTIAAATTHVSFDIWFDKWTPGDSGTLIHTWYVDSTNDDVIWRSLDTASDTLGTARNAFVGLSAVSGRGCFVSGTKTRSGYLYAAFDIDAGAERGLVRSTDGGTNWSSNLSTTFVEATIDECQLFPASNTGDNNDCWAIYQDADADALTMKMWDSSAAAAVESATMQTMIESATDGQGQGGYSGSVRHSDGNLIVVSMSERDISTADMQVWEVSAVNSGSLTGITAKTNITTDIDDIYYPSVFIDQNTDSIYVGYNGKRDGSETLGTSTKIYYTVSTNGGSSWSAGDTTYMEGAAAASLQVWAPLMGPRFSLCWRPTVTAQLITNKVNSLNLVKLTVAAGTFTETGQTANLLFGRRLTAAHGSFSHTGQDVTLTYTPAGAPILTAGHGSFTFTGQAVTLSLAHKIAADSGNFTLTGQSVNLLWKHLLSAAFGSFTETGQSVNLLFSHKLSLAHGSFTQTGQSVNLLWKHRVAADFGSFTFSGQNVTLTYTAVGAFTIPADQGSFTLSGQSINLLWKHNVSTAFGAFTHTGQSVNLLWKHSIPVAFGSFTFTGQTVTLTYTPAATLSATSGSFALSGQTANLLFGHKISAAQASFTLTGEDASFLIGRAIAASHAIFSLAGQDVTLSHVVGDITITADQAIFILDGFSVSFRTIYAETPYYISQFGGTLMSINQSSATEIAIAQGLTKEIAIDQSSVTEMDLIAKR